MVESFLSECGAGRFPARRWNHHTPSESEESYRNPRWRRPRQRLTVIPGHPVLRPMDELLSVLLHLGQIVEGIGRAELAAVDEAYEEVAHAGTVFGLVEERSFAMKNGLLERPLADIIIQRCPSHSQKEGELAPVIFHVCDRPNKGLIPKQNRGIPVPFHILLPLPARGEWAGSFCSFQVLESRRMQLRAWNRYLPVVLLS